MVTGEHYMPVFHDCIVTAKGMHAMCSYNSMNGVPTCGDPNLLNGVLRDKVNTYSPDSLDD